jgi:hypothetical protein
MRQLYMTVTAQALVPGDIIDASGWDAAANVPPPLRMIVIPGRH